jgi:hypothetical protein
MKIAKVFLIIISLVLIVACGNNNSGAIDMNSLINDSQKGNVEISSESLNEIIGSIPSPIEIAMVIKQSGTPFSEKLLNPQDNASLYSTDLEKALNIGIYGGDLGYINIFEKSYLTVNYLSTVKGLADDINIGQFFDFAMIKRMASNSDKMDSLIYLSTINFNRMDEFLRSQKRSKLSLLMVTGTWTEGLYIASQVAKSNSNKELTDWVGYQKIIINQLLLGLSAYKDEEYFNKIVTDLNLLKEQFDNVTITYEYHEPESIEVDGRLVIVDKSTSIVNISPELITKIGDITGEIRSRLIHNI